MTPLHIEILLWYYGRANEFPFEGNATRIEYANSLASSGMLYKLDGATLHYSITTKGRFWIEYVMQLPLPVEKWVIPDQETPA